MQYKDLHVRAQEARRNRAARVQALHPETGEYLHMSGLAFVKDDFLAWRGTGQQFDNMAAEWRRKGVELQRYVLQSFRDELTD